VTKDFEGRRAALVDAYLSPAAERPASTARGVHHAALICSDVERTIEFYQSLLGFPLVDVRENRDYPGSTHFFFDLGHGNMLAFFDFPGHDMPPWMETLGNLQHIAISIDAENWERLKGRLSEAGVEYVGPDRGATNSLYFRGPDGEGIELLKEPLMVHDGKRLNAGGAE
jgi:glyoxylase I family protein